MIALLNSKGKAKRRLGRSCIFVLVLAGLLTPPAHARSVLEKLDDAVAAMAAYRTGDSPEALELVYSLAVKAQESDAARRALSVRLAGLVEGNATLEAKTFACKQLHLIGGDESVPVLARALADPKLAEVALYALDGIRTPAADLELRNALQGASPKLTVSILNSLSERRDAFSVKTLAGLVYRKDDAIATAAIEALGHIGNEQAARAIARARVGAPEPRKTQLTEALLIAADNLRHAGNDRAAVEFYQELYGAAGTSMVKLAAFRGLAESLGQYASPVVSNALTSGTYELAAAACEFVAVPNGTPAETAAYCDLLPSLGQDVQPLLIDALADRGDKAAAPVVRTFVAPEQPIEVRTSAIGALAKLGDATDVPTLHQAAAVEETAEAAGAAFARLSGPGVSQAVVNAASTGPVDERLPLIEALADRADAGTVPALLQFAGEADARIRAAAFDACASAADSRNIADIGSLLLEETDADARNSAERALVALSKQKPDYAAGELYAYLKQAKDDEAARASLLRALATTEQPIALDALEDAAKSRDDSVKQTAIQALANWPTPAPLDALEKHAKGSKNDPLRAEAFRGYIQLLRLPSDRTTKETIKRFAKARKLAETTDDKKLLLAGLADIPGRDAIKLAEKVGKDKDVAEEAALAVERIEKASYRAIASHAAGDVDQAFDSNARTRWTTRTAQQPGQWFQLDLGWEREIAGITLDAQGSSEDYPRGYEVYISDDGEDWGQPVAVGRGEPGVMTITFKPRKAQHIRIVQTGEAENYFWSIHEVSAIE